MRNKHRTRKGIQLWKEINHNQSEGIGFEGDFVLEALDKQQMQEEAFSELPLCPKRQILQKELAGHKSLPLELLEPERWALITGEGVPYISRQALSQTIMPLLCSSKCPFMFPENQLLSPKRPPPSILRTFPH